MNIFKKIQQTKKEIIDFRDKQQQKRAVATANSLKELKEKRQALEGREKIYMIEEKEKEKINKLQQNLKKRTPAYRIANAIRDNLREKQKQNMKKGSSGFGNMSIGQNFDSGNGKVGDFSVGQNFNLGNKKGKGGLF